MLDLTKGVIELRNKIADLGDNSAFLRELANKNAGTYIFRASPAFTPEGAANIAAFKELFPKQVPRILIWANLMGFMMTENQDPKTRWQFDFDMSHPESDMMRTTDGELALAWVGFSEASTQYWLDPKKARIEDFGAVLTKYADLYPDLFDGWMFDYASESPWILPNGEDSSYRHEPDKSVFKSWQASALCWARTVLIGGRDPFIMANGRWVAEKNDLLNMVHGILFESFGTHWKSPDAGIEWMKSRLEFNPDLEVFMDNTVGPKAGDWDVWTVERTLAEYTPETYTACERSG